MAFKRKNVLEYANCIMMIKNIGPGKMEIVRMNSI